MTFTKARARYASLTRSRAADDPDLVAAKRDMHAERIAEYVARAVAAAPDLTPEQRDKIAVILRRGVAK